MEKKKTDKADLEKKRTIFFKIGLVVALSLVLGLFEWTSEDVEVEEVLIAQEEVLEEELIPVTRQEEPQVQPPAPQIRFDEILIVDDDVELDEELEIEDAEFDEDAEVNLDIPLELEPEEEEDPNYIFIHVAEMPEFPGGNNQIIPWVNKHVRYPAIAQENGIQGTVIVQFVVEPDGSVDHVEVLKGVDRNLDKAAVDVIKLMPKWKPGKQRDRYVRVRYHVPIRFELQ